MVLLRMGFPYYIVVSHITTRQSTTQEEKKYKSDKIQKDRIKIRQNANETKFKKSNYKWDKIQKDNSQIG